ncbi:hypothetical protein DMX03_16725 [Pseudomonas koreensis]|nr:hypothetical protein DMX03_16725 [Pseudomonas koreensis]PYB97911.1 hypothetical protein DMX04_20070 [Pseudomonas koreensis]
MAVAKLLQPGNPLSKRGASLQNREAMEDLVGAQRMKLLLHCPESILGAKSLNFLNFSTLDDSVRTEQTE